MTPYALAKIRRKIRWRSPRREFAAHKQSDRSEGIQSSVAEVLVESHNLVKIYKAADLEVVALQGLDLRVPVGRDAGPGGTFRCG